MTYVRTLFYESDSLVFLDEGPLDHYLAELLVAAISMPGDHQGHIHRGERWVPVVSARIISAQEHDR